MLRLMSTELVMPSNHLVLYHPLLLLPSIFPSIRVFSKESALCIIIPLHFKLHVDLLIRQYALLGQWPEPEISVAYL